MTTLQQRDSEVVLVALDGSPAAATALPYGRVLAAQLGARMEIVHIATEAAPDAELWERLHHDLGERERIQVRSHPGESAAGILRAASGPGVVLLVMTTHGRTLEPGRALGRVAETVIARTQRPVLLVRPDVVSTPPPPLRHLLVPLDGTATTIRALQPATELAGRLGASIDLLLVVDAASAPLAEEPLVLTGPRYVDQAQHEWPAWRRETVRRFGACLKRCPANMAIQPYLVQGQIGAEIVRFAANHHADAIVLLRRSHLEVGRARTLRAVLNSTPCPVLLVTLEVPAVVIGGTYRLDEHFSPARRMLATPALA